MAKLQYWWKSDDPKEMKVFGISILFGLFINALCLFEFSGYVKAGRPAIEESMSLESVSGLLLVSLGWIFVVCSTTTAQVLLKEHGPESAKEVALRSLGNTLEYGLMSMMLIWMHGVYCNAAAATLFGGIYIFARLLYPYFYGFYGEFTMMVEFSTQPGYFAKGYLLLGLLVTIFNGQDLIANVADVWYQPFVCLGAWFVYMFFFGMIIGYPLFRNFQSGAEWKRKFDEAKEENSSGKEEES